MFKIISIALIGFSIGTIAADMLPKSHDEIAVRLAATRDVCANTRAAAVAEMFSIQQQLVERTVSKFDAIAAGNELRLRVIEVNKFYGCNL